MKRLPILVATLLLSCAAGPKYHMSEGPPRIKISAPRMVNTEQVFLLKVIVEGETAALPFGDIVGIEVQANDIPLARSAFTLQARYITVQMQLSPSFYSMFRNPLRGPMDFDEIDPASLPPIEGADEEDFDLVVKLKVTLTQLEINYKNELTPLRQIAHSDWNMRLTCVHRECINAYEEE